MAAGFMAGFGTKFSELIEEDRKYYRDRAAKRQEYLQTYGTRAVADREGKANAALGVANYLITNGISKDDVRYVVDTSGVQGLAQLKATIDSRTDLTADEKSSLVKKAKDYVAENPDEDLNTVVKRAYGLYKSSDNPVKRERSLFGSILGLDSRMMEDEVMDDLYINGYTGRDVYRIMGSAGPTPGSPLDLDLPLKPLSSQVQRNIALMITDKFESSVDAQLAKKDTEWQTADADRRLEIVKEKEELETFKGQGIAGIGPYANKYDTSIFDYAKALYDEDPRNIEGNTNLLMFASAFTDYFADQEDEAKVAEVAETDKEAEVAETDKVDMSGAPGFRERDDLAATSSTTAAADTTTPPTVTAHVVETEAEAMDLLKSGTVKLGDTLQIGNNPPRSVLKLPEAVEAKAAPKTTDLGDMSGAPGFRKRDDVSVAMTQEVQQAATSLKESLPEDLQAEFDTFINEDGGALMFNSILANEPLPEDLQEELKKFESEDVPSVMDYIKNFRGVRSDLTLAEKFADPLFFLDPKYYGGSTGTTDLGDMTGAPGFRDETNELDAALQRLPDHVEKLGEQGMDAWRKLTATVPTEAPKSYTQEEILAWYENRVNTQEKADMEERIRDDARQFLQDEKSFPQPLPRIVIDTLADDVVEEAKVDREVTRVVQQLNNKGETPSPKDIEDLKTTLELNQEIDTSTDELYRGPISGKTLVEKLDDIWNFYTSEEPEYDPRAVGTVGFRDLGLRDTTDDVRPPRNREPDAQTRTRAPLGDTRTEPDATVPSISAVDTSARPSGLMSPDKDTRKVNVGDLATFADPELMNNIETAHGSGSKTFKDFEKKISSGTMKPADITRLIKATRKLPKTTSRGKLLDSLFDLRDALNKR
jgi:hypothetical protein